MFISYSVSSWVIVALCALKSVETVKQNVIGVCLLSVKCWCVIALWDTSSYLVKTDAWNNGSLATLIQKCITVFLPRILPQVLTDFPKLHCESAQWSSNKLIVEVRLYSRCADRPSCAIHNTFLHYSSQLPPYSTAAFNFSLYIFQSSLGCARSPEEKL